MGLERIKAALGNDPWLITEPGLQTIVDVVAGANEDPETVAAKIGRPLQNTRTVTIRDSSAIIPVTGPIFRYANLFTEISGATSVEVLAKDFRAAEENPDIDTIILVLDSPGGQASGIAEIAEQIRSSSKKTIAYIDNFAASAGYWIAAAASEIVINKSAEAGSVGVVFATRVRKETGEVTIVSRQSPNKRLEPGSVEWSAELQKRADDLAEIFIGDVASYRNVTREKVIADFGQGGLLLGQAAVDAGMADSLGTFEGLFSKKEEVVAMSEQFTVASLKTDHPDVASALIEEGKALGREEGRAAEVARIQSVREQSIPGHEALVETLMFDGKSTGADAALAIVQAEKSARKQAASDFKETAPAPVTQPAVTTTGKKKPDNMTAEEQIKHDWDNDPEERDAFDGDFESYKCYREQAAAGNVKILGGKG